MIILNLLVLLTFIIGFNYGLIICPIGFIISMLIIIDNYKTFRKYEITFSFYNKNLFFENSVISGTNHIEEAAILNQVTDLFYTKQSFESFY